MKRWAWIASVSLSLIIESPATSAWIVEGKLTFDGSSTTTIAGTGSKYNVPSSLENFSFKGVYADDPLKPLTFLAQEQVFESGVRLGAIDDYKTPGEFRSAYSASSAMFAWRPDQHPGFEAVNTTGFNETGYNYHFNFAKTSGDMFGIDLSGQNVAYLRDLTTGERTFRSSQFQISPFVAKGNLAPLTEDEAGFTADFLFAPESSAPYFSLIAQDSAQFSPTGDDYFGRTTTTYRPTSLQLTFRPVTEELTFRDVFEDGGLGAVEINLQEGSPIMRASFQPLAGLTLDEAAALSGTIGESFTSFNWLQTITDFGYLDDAGIFYSATPEQLDRFEIELSFDPPLGGREDNAPWYLNPGDLLDLAILGEDYLNFEDSPYINAAYGDGISETWRFIFSTQLVGIRDDGSGKLISDIFPELNTGFEWQFTQYQRCDRCGVAEGLKRLHPSVLPNGTAEFLRFAPGRGISAVPEPASWAMMIGGFGIIGGALRRRQQIAKRLA